MFETLTASEAKRLTAELKIAYDDSRDLCREVAGWRQATNNAAIKASYNHLLNSQAAMRAEVTSLMWQLKRETGQ